MMIDIETLGTSSNSVILSIAAVPFDMVSGKNGTPYYTNVDIQSCLDNGLEISGDTLRWWMRQDKVAIGRLAEGGLKLMDALDGLARIIALHDGVQVWGNSARFDLGILENAFHRIGRPIPWKFYDERDVRTLVSFEPEIKANMPFVGTPHDAADDCLHQIRYCSAIWNKLKK